MQGACSSHSLTCLFFFFFTLFLQRYCVVVSKHQNCDEGMIEPSWRSLMSKQTEWWVLGFKIRGQNVLTMWGYQKVGSQFRTGASGAPLMVTWHTSKPGPRSHWSFLCVALILTLCKHLTQTAVAGGMFFFCSLPLPSWASAPSSCCTFVAVCLHGNIIRHGDHVGAHIRPP